MTTTTLNSPTQPLKNTPKTQIPVASVVEKTATTTTNGKLKTTKDTSTDFAKVKSVGSVPKQPVLATSKTATTTSQKKVETKKTPVKSETKPATNVTLPVATTPKDSGAPRLETSSSTASTTIPQAPIDFNAINLKARQAIVNIICTSAIGGVFEPISGSGVLVDERGIILTNAHVAQFMLLEDSQGGNILNCIARTGSPATPAYKIKVLYISPEWVRNNYKNITKQNPTGTGENDFALLQITGSTNPDRITKPPFPAILTKNNENKIERGNPVVIVGYPAGFLGGIAIQRDLFIVSSVVSIGRLYTFKTGTLDSFGLGGSPVAQHGSSGGAVVNTEGNLIGIIVTSTDAKDTAKRDLDALSVAHINRVLSAESSLTLTSLSSSNLEYFNKFSTEILPELKKLLSDIISVKN